MPLSDHYIHFNHAGVSPMSQRSSAAIEQVVEAMLNEPYRSGRTQEEADRVRVLAARLINGSPDGVALTRSTAHGVSLLAQGLDWKSGDNVVGAKWEYPGNVYPWMALALVESNTARPRWWAGASCPMRSSRLSMSARGWCRSPTSNSGMAFESMSRRLAPSADVAASCSPST